MLLGPSLLVSSLSAEASGCELSCAQSTQLFCWLICHETVGKCELPSPLADSQGGVIHGSQMHDGYGPASTSSRKPGGWVVPDSSMPWPSLTWLLFVPGGFDVADTEARCQSGFKWSHAQLLYATEDAVEVLREKPQAG